MTLTPAVMHLLGDRAWYIPRWLDRLLPDLDVEGVKLAERLESGALGGAPTASEPRRRPSAGTTGPASRSRDAATQRAGRHLTTRLADFRASGATRRVADRL